MVHMKVVPLKYEGEEKKWGEDFYPFYCLKLLLKGRGGVNWRKEVKEMLMLGKDASSEEDGEG